MTEGEIGFAAGIIEGEGCLDRNHGHPRIRVEMKDMDVIYRLQAIIGGTIHYPAAKKNPKWARTAALSVNGRVKVQQILETIRPWMGERRGAKIDQLLGD